VVLVAMKYCLLLMTARQLSRLSEAYTAEEFCHHILPVIVGNLAKDQVATVRQAAIEAVSFLVIFYSSIT